MLELEACSTDPYYSIGFNDGRYQAGVYDGLYGVDEDERSLHGCDDDDEYDDGGGYADDDDQYYDDDDHESYYDEEYDQYDGRGLIVHACHASARERTRPHTAWGSKMETPCTAGGAA